MSNEQRGPGPQRPDSVRAEVLRPDDGASISVRILATGPILGTYFHYTRREGGKPCLGVDCQCKGRRTGAQWKGYVAAEEWTPHVSAWRPGALEVTEHAAVEIGGILHRGEIWVLSREPKRPGKSGKVTAVLAEVRAADSLRPAFDVRDILWHLYRAHVILEERCPIPPKPVMDLVHDEPPKGVATVEPRLATPEEIRAKLTAAGIRPPEVAPSNGRKSGVRYT
jgi:hypothetical protein